MATFPLRHSIARARFFLEQAHTCACEQRDEHESYLEASIVFARAALHRLRTAGSKVSGFAEWFNSIGSNECVQFFRKHRDVILKEQSPRVSQIIYVGSHPDVQFARQFYYFTDPQTPASDTVRIHLDALSTLVYHAEVKYLGREVG